MTFDSYDSLWKELRQIIKSEAVELVYEELMAALGEMIEGEYRPSIPKKIFIASFYEKKDRDIVNFEPIVVAHELGHYFDWKQDKDVGLSILEREKRANDYMVELCTKHGLREDALRERERRERQLQDG